MPRRNFSGFPINVDEFISVEQLGAKGDGAADDTAVFQAAIDQLSAIGGVIYVPEGDFQVTGGSLNVGSKTVYWLLNGHINSTFTPSSWPGFIINNSTPAADSVTIAMIADGTAGDLLYWDGSGEAQALAIGTNGQVLTISGGLPVWGSGSGSGTMTTVKGNGSQVGDADIVTLDFSSLFTVAESPDTEINVGLNATGADGNVVTGTAGTSGNLASWNADGDAVDSGLAPSGSDTSAITGTAGTNGNLGQWNADGDLVDAGVATSDLATATQGTAQTPSSVTEQDFTGIASGANEIKVMLSGISTNGSSQLLIQLGDSGGFETSGYVSQASEGESGSTSTAGFLIKHGGSASDPASGIVILSRIDGNTWVSSGNIDLQNGQEINVSAGTKALSAELDRIRLTTVNGTDQFDAGTVNIRTS